VYLITDNDAGCGVVRELRIMGVAESLEEGKGTREVGDREIDEDFGVHLSDLFSCFVLIGDGLRIFKERSKLAGHRTSLDESQFARRTKESERTPSQNFF
jgi:hypothetical protein